MKIAVIGGGSWGTAIARLLHKKGHEVNFFVRNDEDRKSINEKGINEKYLPGVELAGLKAQSDILSCVDSCEMIVMAVPTQKFREVAQSIKDKADGKVIVNLSKGLELKTLDRVSEISAEIMPNSQFVSLSGPSHAEEVGKEIPTAIVAASTSNNASKLVQETFATDTFRVYTNSDLIGVEIGGALKNIIALAAGMSDGLGYGDNTTAALATRGIYEMSKLGMKLGANPQTFNGLSGIGDLIVTCTSKHSRNRRAGILIGQGLSSEEASEKVGQVVEGIKTTKSAHDLALKYGVNMPITEKLYEVLYNNKDPREAVVELMTRGYKQEIEEIFFE
ncbi:glycerol-3-phosphate dehydrogenase (NAD(P)+) [Peptoniphilus asaccharolyticus DSM 20463]|uniref:Glycerol-3-phosphate dehydrogenase [NAD(P)+] n=1 Tax=Peptoniphilus asaccharolyticus DSM 20463 TaxID=573058 RepID=A0A1W1URM6_PEPAS|nr:NAD(P)H-dependent glycerol-3-phosphate dehydrogenase [Peptoniphilus asaccharolyticus]MBL7575040.1 NAD(P)H-dependent glycerol-3-phosphate dehydrogenase [Peptoniphilus asaccharolyticus]MBL7575065.1 NAD(P)H-dependent glycerol-3-phosphate dehydrogenase [Peptoniphilus asaccharolyticus]SMB83461.1 glycerol-3-phosphate dehydrogenase (NAD(P)+) [Peptoniphilus asaccharolyticus DSM 20463]